MSVTGSEESWQFIFSERSSRNQQTIKQGFIPVAEVRRIALPALIFPARTIKSVSSTYGLYWKGFCFLL